MFKKLNIVRDRSFYGTLISLCIPLALQSMLAYSVNTLDSIMLGALGEVPMSAVNIGLQPFNIVSGIIRGLILGGTVLMAQYYGKGDTKSIKTTMAICMRVNLLISVVCTLVTGLFPKPIMGIFSTDQAVIDAGVGYLRVISFTYALYAISLTYQLTCRALQDARTPLIINLITYATNIGLNYCFIFGKFGCPQMGVTGAAVGTLIARVLEFALCGGHLLLFNKTLQFKPADFFAKSKRLTGDIWKYGLPSLLSEMIFTLGMSAYAIIFGRLGTLAMAANSIASIATRIGETFTGCIASASAVMIGKTIGEGDLDRAKLQVKTFNVVSMCAALCSIVILLAINPILISLYNIAPETVEMAKQMCFFNALFQIAYAFEMLYVCGLLVGSGDTNYIFWYTTIIMWGITMPIAFAGAFLFKWSPIVVFIILKCDYVIKGVVGYIRTKGNKWIKEVTVSK